ncbi:type II secretion system F family protein [Acetobacter sacchari]|uniref:Type II secretion system F family protein n=1 Tax=Acetobacter sacchari TaxID=2661687 RepID=A0ABS3LY90_9PROT|nr:type II secretion system F family protein [Acetobacter sacchari]MBO1360848.1 type II secretion system F family protein [Acetobacter sacchari]
MIFLILQIFIVFVFFLVAIERINTNKQRRVNRLMEICSAGQVRTRNDNILSKVKTQIIKYARIVIQKNYISNGAHQAGKDGTIAGKFFCKDRFNFGVDIVFFSFFIFGYMSFNVLKMSFVASIVLGIITPDMMFGYLKKIHLSGVDSGLPDALDLFLICADAGLGMETSMERVAKEMKYLNGKTALEFLLTVDEMKVNPNHAAALTGLGARTGLPAMLRLSSALIQTLETGASLRSVVKVLVAEIREENLIRFETQAARLSVLLTIPMIIFLLPCVFIVIAGPAVIKIMDVLGR